MFLIFGTRTVETLIVLVTMVCPNCHVEARQRVLRLDNRFTLFFFPLFRLSTRHAVDCSNCGVLTGITKEQVDDAVEQAARSGNAQA